MKIKAIQRVISLDLLDYSLKQELANKAPLAERMRPQSLEDFIGQEKIVGPKSLLRRAIENDNLSSLIFYGPPGTGKTALAKIIANYTRGFFTQLNAVTDGVKDLRKALEEAKKVLSFDGIRTILFIDEIHRFNKSQQDALLPAVEAGIVILIGATTENPFFNVNSPLLSRSQIYTFTQLIEEDIRKIIKKALADEKRGLKKYNPEITEDAMTHLVDFSSGDARRALNALETAVVTAEPDEKDIRKIGLSQVEESMQKKQLRYDKDGDNHYDVISAFIKSIRGSDPDAALYWLARMLEAGEDPNFICRRVVISAAEDVGNADPRALQLAVAAAQAVQMLGLPEGRIPLAQAVTYLAAAPKSNAAYMGINRALKYVSETGSLQVPGHLKDSHYPGAKNLGHGKGYRYPHDYPGNYVKQEYLPLEAKNEKFYSPGENGIEKKIKEKLDRLAGKKNE